MASVSLPQVEAMEVVNHNIVLLGDFNKTFRQADSILVNRLILPRS